MQKNSTKKTVVREHERKLSSDSHKNEESLTFDLPVQIVRDKNTLKITSDDPKIIKKIEKWLQKNLPQILE